MSSKQRYLEIDGNRYIGIGDGDWLGAFHQSLADGWSKGWTTKDSKGRYWLVMVRNKQAVLIW